MKKFLKYEGQHRTNETNTCMIDHTHFHSPASLTGTYWTQEDLAMFPADDLEIVDGEITPLEYGVQKRMTAEEMIDEMRENFVGRYVGYMSDGRYKEAALLIWEVMA